MQRAPITSKGSKSQPLVTTKKAPIGNANRKEAISREELETIADGRVYTAAQAHSLKLIDELGYFDTALKKILELARLEEANVIAYTYYPKSKTNIYAASYLSSSFLEKNNAEKILSSLRSGFYYLWLPQATR